MKKTLFIFCLICSFFFISAKPILAGDTGWVSIGDLTSGSVWNSNMTTTTASCPTNQAWAYRDTTGFTGIPAGQKIFKVEVQGDYKINAYLCTSVIWKIKLAKDHTTQVETVGQYDITWTNTAWHYGEEWSVDSDFTIDDVANLHLVQYARCTSDTNENLQMANLKFKLHYQPSNATLNLVNATASPSAQKVYLDLAGDTATKSANMKCDVGVLERCSRSGYAGWTSQTPVAHIILEDGANTTADTIEFSPNYYYGVGWSATDSTWTAHISVPYNPGYTCDYPMSMICTHRDCSSTVINGRTVNTCGETIIDSQTNWLLQPDFVATPSATISAQLYTEPEPDNPLAWIVWKAKNTFIELFVPNFGSTIYEYEQLRTNLEERAPFAYAQPVFNMDWSFAETSTSAPSISFPLVVGDTPSIEWDPPVSMGGFTNSVRAVLSVVLWFSLIIYFVMFARRVW